jgi:hypothetical protein
MSAKQTRSMPGRIFFLSLFLLIFASAFYSYDLKDKRAASFAGEKTLVLYDAASGEIPDTSLMTFTDFPPGDSSLTYAEHATVLDTTIKDKDTYAGWVASQATTPGFPILDRTTGVRVNFTIQVEREMHTSNSRAGFSMILLDQDARGIELSFWENEIWVQSDDQTGGLFKHGEGVTFSTTTNLTDYQVTLDEAAYTLTANSETLLSGPLRDYSKFDGFPDPYETPNFLFLGDDTTSAESRVRLGRLSITGKEPVIPTAKSTSTSISSPAPTDSPAPLPGVTPVPSPAQPNKVFEPCPSSGFLVMLAVTVWIKKTRRRKDTL